ncbi:hypothetical protein RBH94_15115 [Aestuariibaculum sp. YM273]|uniref:hypothetical protein n=1 Tax=Aestuariibaculum sp. YM273 TaxID=3070659 RepID=UPI0027DB83B7|nr:hypothetical protein [Aestuariibaculum sp. YM273]WMI65381.1 hypothetical protein RBH94_15115 [Aestuariibaculum sp. YM273]
MNIETKDFFNEDGTLKEPVRFENAFKIGWLIGYYEEHSIPNVEYSNAVSMEIINGITQGQFELAIWNKTV